MLKGLQDETFADVIFLVGNQKKKFHASRVVVSLHSAVLKNMLFGEQASQQRGAEVSIPEVTIPAFESCLRYMYGLPPATKIENAVDTLYAATKYMIGPMQKALEGFIRANMRPETILIFLSAATRTRLEEIRRDCMTYLTSHPEQTESLMNSDSFLTLNQETMAGLIKSDSFVVQEEQLWERLLEWAKSQGKTNTVSWVSVLKPIRLYVRFPLMSPIFFIHSVKSAGVLSKDELLDLACYYLDTSQPCKFIRHKLSLHNTEPRYAEMPTRMDTTAAPSLSPTPTHHSQSDSAFASRRQQDVRIPQDTIRVPEPPHHSSRPSKLPQTPHIIEDVQIAVSSHWASHTPPENLLDGRLDTYWQSDGPKVQDHDDFSPSEIVVRAGKDVTQLTQIKTTNIERKKYTPTLLHQDDYSGILRVIQIDITCNHDSGYDSRITGFQILGSQVSGAQDALDLLQVE